MNVPDALEQHRAGTTWPATHQVFKQAEFRLQLDHPRRRTVCDRRSISDQAQSSLVSAAVVCGLRPNAATRNSSENAKGFTNTVTAGVEVEPVLDSAERVRTKPGYDGVARKLLTSLARRAGYHPIDNQQSKPLPIAQTRPLRCLPQAIRWPSRRPFAT
jgi:hypothetical protein